MRKDFIFDPYQVYEARSVGADALLLIVAMLEPSQLKELLDLTQELWMQCLVEIHDLGELAIALDVGAEILGMNNRDLRTFNTDLAVSEDLAPKVPRGKIIVSESGISQPYHMHRLASIGVNAVLVGEALVTADDVAEKVREFTGQAVSTNGDN
jgi:indole-3-glycerol phosphate synthase